MSTTQIDVTRQAKFSGDTSIGHKLTSVTDPTSSQDAATKNYVDSVAQGFSPKTSCRVATVGTENFTISSGAVTTITGTTLDGISVAIGDRIMIKDAPASTGTGSVLSDLPANGIYVVTANTTNLSVSRSTDLSGTNGPAGAYALVEAGSANKGTAFVVTDPSTNTGFTYNTSNIQWTKFSSATSGTVTTLSVVTNNGFSGTVANVTSTPAITIQSTVTGIVKGNGTALSAATAGVDYMAPADFVTRETPSGSINSSNTSFVLANTPLAGTEQVFLNGILQEPGAGNDYTISSGTITYLSAPITGDRLRVTYQK